MVLRTLPQQGKSWAQLDRAWTGDGVVAFLELAGLWRRPALDPVAV
jgi:hypothetical protein